MDANDLSAAETIPASRKLGRDDAARLLAGKKTLYVAKGRKVRELKLPDDEAPDAMLGPTGNLRAPTLVVGKTVLVGFHEDTYADVFG